MLSFLRFFILVSAISCTDIFHTNSVIRFKPDKEASYFGYSVLLSSTGVYVGAPKARSRVNSTISPGLVFMCPLNLNSNNSLCEPIYKIAGNNSDLSLSHDDGWYGATIAPLPDGKILACAPRIQESLSLIYANVTRMRGKCYLSSNSTIEAAVYPLTPLDETHLPYHAEAGMSVKVHNYNTIIIGAPGLHVGLWKLVSMRYTWSTSEFTLYPWTFSKYNIIDLELVDYFGYSVESGVFEKDGPMLYVGGAPRSTGYGQVLVYDPISTFDKKIEIKVILNGTQYGSYFGASLCVVDLDGDGLSDLLVGAPNYANSNTYDQGAVFVYMSRHTEHKFHLKLSISVSGSAASGAKFGTSIAELGDINSDKYNDVAIGAPWEDDGRGVVYIYEGYADGLRAQYTQRIQAEGAKGFGMSISKGFDVDGNNCNDLAVGAYGSDTAYLYRCVPTLQVMVTIQIPDAQNLNLRTDNFTAIFCINVTLDHVSPFVKTDLELQAVLLIDREDKLGKASHRIGEIGSIHGSRSVYSGCNEYKLKINKSSDFTKPISLKFYSEPNTDIDRSMSFPTGLARLSPKSVLHTPTLYVQLANCGQDLICTPWLEVSMVPFKSYHVPGDGSTVGAKVKVVNTGESAYSVMLHVTLPCGLKRLPHSCSLYNLDLYCNIPAPLHTNQSEQWNLELDYQWDGQHDELKLTARIEDNFYSRNITGKEKTITIQITPKSEYEFSRKTEPNRTVTILRDTFDYKKDIEIKHIYEIYNKGPSALYHVNVTIMLPEEFTLSTKELGGNELNFGIPAIPAHKKSSLVLPLRFNYTCAGEKLGEQLGLNITSKAYFHIKNYYKSIGENRTEEITTTVLLEPKSYLHLYIIVSILVGIAVLAIIVRILHKKVKQITPIHLVVSRSGVQMRGQLCKRQTDTLAIPPLPTCKMLLPASFERPRIVERRKNFDFFTRKTKKQLILSAEKDADEPGISSGETKTWNPNNIEDFEDTEEVQ